MNLIQSRNAQCGTVAFYNASGQKPFVPLVTVPITITAAGELLDIRGQFTLSGRPDDSQGYAGFKHVYTCGGGLLMTASDPRQLVDVPLSSGTQLDPFTVRDAWWGGGTDTSPMNPYVNHNREALYVTTEADIGQRFIVMLGYCSSSYASQSDYLLNEQMEGELSVLQLSGATQATPAATAPIVVATPVTAPQPATVIPPPEPVSPPAPPAPAPSPGSAASPWASIWAYLTGNR